MDIGVEPDPLDPAFGRDQRITVEAVASRGIVRLEIAVLNELRVTAAIPRVIDLLEKDALHPRIGGHSRGSRVDVDVHFPFAWPIKLIGAGVNRHASTEEHQQDRQNWLALKFCRRPE